MEERNQGQEKKCCLCRGRRQLTFHHLIPRACHTNKWFRKQYGKETMRERGVIICRKCHYFIHEQFSEKDLGRRLNTLEKLAQEPVVVRYAGWARKQNR